MLINWKFVIIKNDELRLVSSEFDGNSTNYPDSQCPVRLGIL